MQSHELHSAMSDIIAIGNGRNQSIDDIAENLVDYLKANDLIKMQDCPYTFSHTKNWCDYHGCRES